MKINGQRQILITSSFLIGTDQTIIHRAEKLIKSRLTELNLHLDNAPMI